MSTPTLARVQLLLAAGLIAAACTSPVRLATSSEIPGSHAPTPSPVASAPAINQATPAPSPSPGASPAAPSNPGLLGQLQAAYRAIVDAVLPSVVEIDTGSGEGSGVVMDASGDIVTNAHVVEGASNLTVKTSSGQSYSATLVGTYPNNDLAVIKVAAGSGDGASGLKPATFGDSSQVHLGDIAVAIGNPLGLMDSVSEGVVSGTGRTQDEGNGVTLSDLIQTTAAIAPGSSGGALVDINGRVIGITTLGAVSGRGGSAGAIGFAISSNQVVSVTKQPPSSSSNTPRAGAPGSAYLGVTVASDAGGAAVITGVEPGGPADSAGVPSGVTVMSIDGQRVPSPSALSGILGKHKPGDTIALSVRLPSGSARTYQVTLGTHP